MRSIHPRAWLLALIVLAAGCASLPEPRSRPVEQALQSVDDTPLAGIARDAVPAGEPPTRSAFRLLFAGESAFNVRIALARRATRSLDLQTYVVADDETGRGLLRELRDAALRGVRVRLLVDDLHAGDDRLLAGLAAYPNVQVRLFNPLPVRGGSLAMRLLLSLHQFARINQRMHNKLFIADNSLAVLGGRNVADEYFMNSPEANFVDLDVLAAGPVVRDLSAVFDRFWNSTRVFAIDDLADREFGNAERERFDAAVRRAIGRLGEQPHDPLGHPSLLQEFDSGRLSLVPAPARVLADSPDKVVDFDSDAAERGPTAAQQTLALMAAAREAVLVMSPYFIPGTEGMRIIHELTGRAGGRVTLLTNSLGATDQPLAHAAYARYRFDLLKAGVRIFELGPTVARDSGRVGDFGRTTGRLHSKTLAIDGRWVVIGSMNLDPRSTHVNTEIGLVIDSPELARQVETVFERGTALGTYRLRLGAGERIEWAETDWQGLQTIRRSEPDDNPWRSFKRWLLGWLVPEELL
jgi:putative cardiolipin synthase